MTDGSCLETSPLLREGVRQRASRAPRRLPRPAPPPRSFGLWGRFLRRYHSLNTPRLIVSWRGQRVGSLQKRGTACAMGTGERAPATVLLRQCLQDPSCSLTGPGSGPLPRSVLPASSRCALNPNGPNSQAPLFLGSPLVAACLSVGRSSASLHVVEASLPSDSCTD